jgi:hypothetical protein
MWAAENGDDSTVGLLLDGHADVNAADKYRALDATIDLFPFSFHVLCCFVVSSRVIILRTGTAALRSHRRLCAAMIPSSF